MRATTRLRKLLEGPRILLAPGAYDALSARLIQQAGFEAVYVTGAGVTISLLGEPDVGLTTMTEMVDQARRIVAATDLPVIADADTGYGNALNVMRTVREFERAGVAAIHLEDQETPKNAVTSRASGWCPPKIWPRRSRRPWRRGGTRISS
jgi:2-methylisocitrate lyase-like PEP mutase family enzyme